MIVGIDFELLRILLAGTMLGAAAFLDLRKREISDLLWIVFGISALTLYAVEFVLGEIFDPLTIVVSIMMAAAVSFGIYKSRLFGGADALALIILAIILPTFAGGISERILASSSAYLPHTMAPLIVLSNSVILSVSMIGFNLVSNALYISRNPGKLFEGLNRESVAKKIVAIAIGYRTQNKPGHVFPIEQFVEGRRQFSFAMRNVETADYETRENVWVTGGMPFILFMFAGFVTMLFVGDIAAIFMNLIF